MSKKERGRVQKFFTQPSRTRQSFKSEVDINNIVKRFRLSTNAKSLESLHGYVEGTYGDFSEVPDYRTALDQVIQAEESFMALPAKVRKRFSNDPAEFLDFVQNYENLDEMIALGLANPRPKEEALPPSEIATEGE